jgi:hypothetical protein
MSIIAILLTVLVVCVLLWVVQRLLAAFSVGEPVATVVYVVVVLICLFYVLGQFGFGPGIRLT